MHARRIAVVAAEPRLEDPIADGSRDLGSTARDDQRTMLGVQLTGDAPLDQAWSLLARVQVWFGPDEWYAVFAAAQAGDAGARLAALSRLDDAMARSPMRQALLMLVSAAREVPDNLVPHGDGAATTSDASGSRRLNRIVLDEVGRVLARAVLAVALAPRLDAADVGVLAAPVLSVVRVVRAP